MQVKAKHPIKGTLTFATMQMFNTTKRLDDDWKLIKEKKKEVKEVKDNK